MAAKPILLPLREPIVLNPERQKVLAAWAAMTVICAEYLSRQSNSLRHRQALALQHKDGSE
jgi:hypothetical protein